jgi:xanthine dehydrogenase molybdopterin-binding subunit B
MSVVRTRARADCVAAVSFRHLRRIWLAARSAARTNATSTNAATGTAATATDVGREANGTALRYACAPSAIGSRRVLVATATSARRMNEYRANVACIGERVGDGSEHLQIDELQRAAVSGDFRAFACGHALRRLAEHVVDRRLDRFRLRSLAARGM